MPAPKLLIKALILGGKMASSLGLPHILPIRKPHPLPVKLAKWFFLVAVLPALLIDMFHPLSARVGWTLTVIGGVIGTWALSVIGYDWYMMRKAIREEQDEAELGKLSNELVNDDAAMLAAKVEPPGDDDL